MSEQPAIRFTHEYEGELVVFLIGMRINKPWRPDLWLPVFSAMPRMLAELSRDPDSGLMGYRLDVRPGRSDGGPVLELPREALRLRQRPGGQAPAGVDGVQSADSEGSRLGRHLARDLPGGSG